MSGGVVDVSSRADGSIASSGSPLTKRLDTRCSRGRHVRRRTTRFTFVLTDRRCDAIDVKVVSATDLLPNLVEIVEDGIAALHDGFLVGSSSGVQIVGGLTPSER